MTTTLLRNLLWVLLLAACSSPRHSSTDTTHPLSSDMAAQPLLAADRQPQSLMDLPQTQDGGFVLQPGYYEAEFKTYCLQPGTPDPRRGDAYLQGPVTGYRKDIVASVLRNSLDQPRMDQKNIQLLLWSVVSGSDFNRLSYSVQADALKLLTPKQVFELKGGWVGVIKTVSVTTGLLPANSDIKRLFETSVASYEAYERLAVRAEPAQVVRPGVKGDEWYRQREGYYVRYFPESYKKVKIQVYVPDSLLDADNKLHNDYVVFDPTGQQAIPAYTNAQRLGIGAPVLEVLRKVITVNKPPLPPKKIPKKTPQTGPPKTVDPKMQM